MQAAVYCSTGMMRRMSQQRAASLQTEFDRLSDAVERAGVRLREVIRSEDSRARATEHDHDERVLAWRHAVRMTLAAVFFLV